MGTLFVVLSLNVQKGSSEELFHCFWQIIYTLKEMFFFLRCQECQKYIENLGMEIKVAVITAPFNQLHRNIHLQNLMQIFEICVYFMKH